MGPHVICSGSGVDQKADCIALEVANSAIIAVDSQLHEKHDVVMGVTNGSCGDGLPRRKTALGTPQTERESQPASLFQGRCAWPIGLPVQSRRACPPRWPLYHPIAPGGPTPTVEPGVQMEFFRKSSLDYTWKCFNFLETPAEVPDATAQEVSDGPLFDSGSDSSSSASSSSSESDEECMQRPSKKGRKTVEQDVPDELVIAYVSRVQHAMLESNQDWHPYLEGKHYQAACGARLDPDGTRFDRAADPGLALCQRQATLL